MMFFCSHWFFVWCLCQKLQQFQSWCQMSPVVLLKIVPEDFLFTFDLWQWYSSSAWSCRNMICKLRKGTKTSERKCVVCHLIWSMAQQVWAVTLAFWCTHNSATVWDEQTLITQEPWHHYFWSLCICESVAHFLNSSFTWKVVQIWWTPENAAVARQMTFLKKRAQTWWSASMQWDVYSHTYTCTDTYAHGYLLTLLLHPKKPPLTTPHLTAPLYEQNRCNVHGHRHISGQVGNWKHLVDLPYSILLLTLQEKKRLSVPRVESGDPRAEVEDPEAEPGDPQVELHPRGSSKRVILFVHGSDGSCRPENRLHRPDPMLLCCFAVFSIVNSLLSGQHYNSPLVDNCNTEHWSSNFTASGFSPQSHWHLDVCLHFHRVWDTLCHCGRWVNFHSKSMESGVLIDPCSDTWFLICFWIIWRFCDFWDYFRCRQDWQNQWRFQMLQIQDRKQSAVSRILLTSIILFPLLFLVFHMGYWFVIFKQLKEF